jgi:hypothetical protein
MPKLADLLAESQTVEVASVRIEFNPQRLTAGRVEELSQLDESTATVAHVRHVLADIIVSWDLEDEDGPVPPTAETLAHVPFAFLDMLATALLTHLRPSRAEGNALSQPSNGAPSGFTQDSETSPRSSESSSPPGGPESPPGSSPASPPPGSTGSA